MRLAAARCTWKLLPAGVLAGMIVSTGAAAARPDAQPRPERGAQAPATRLLVKFAGSASRRAQADTLAAVGGRAAGAVPALGVDVVSVPSDRAAAALASLRGRTIVSFAELDAPAQTFDVTPNDPWWPNEWSEAKVGAPAAWSATTGSPSTVVAVLDTGADPTQPDLQGAFVPGWNTLANTSATTDTNGHGTNVAGVALARGNNGIGIAGYCWSCSLMPVKVLDTNAGTVSSVSAGITWATDHGARVISMSLGFTAASSTLRSAVQYAHTRGVVMVAAAGNYGTTAPVYPAAYPEVIGVAGTDGGDQLYSWSSHGSWVELAAPGCNFAVGANAWYGTFCGTSSAAPALAGVAALAVSCAPAATNTAIEQALESSAAPIGTAVEYGRVDAHAALASLGCGSSVAAAPPVNTSLPTVSGTAQDGQTLTASAGAWSGGPTGYGYGWQDCDAGGASCTPIAGASAASYTAQPSDVGHTLRVVVTASNGGGSATATSAPTAAVVAAPAASSGTQQTTTFSGSLNPGNQSRSFTVTVGTGPAEAHLSFSKCSTLSLGLGNGPSATGPSVVVLATFLDAGTYQYTVSGGKCSFTLTVAAAGP